MTSSSTHWDDVYRAQRPEQVSWFRPHLDASIELLLSAGLNARSRVIDIGGGAATLVDDLLDRGVEHVTVLDISAAALQVVRRDPEQIAELFAERFRLTGARRETHSTPRGAAQSFAYAVLQRIR